MTAFKLKDFDSELKFFGIVFLIFESLIVAYFATFKESIIENKQVINFLYSNLSFIALIVVFFLIYVKITKSKSDSNTSKVGSSPDELQPKELEAIKSEYYKSFLTSLIEDFSQIDSNENSLFCRYVKMDCDDFATSAEKWKNSTIVVPQVNYDGFLIDAYKNAEQFVFSTSIKDYFSIWSEPFGERILEAHKQSRATTTRIFVFDARKDIQPQFVQLMKSQEEIGIIVRIFIDDEFPEFNFPPDLSKDFTVIDKGKIIGKTVTFGRNRNAEWVFDSQKESNRFQGYIERLEKGSLKISEL